MTQPETETLDAALVEALGVLRVATDEDHRAALQLVALTSLSTPAGAHLWACLQDEAERTFQSVAASELPAGQLHAAALHPLVRRATLVSGMLEVSSAPWAPRSDLHHRSTS